MQTCESTTHRTIDFPKKFLKHFLASLVVEMNFHIQSLHMTFTITTQLTFNVVISLKLPTAKFP